MLRRHICCSSSVHQPKVALSTRAQHFSSSFLDAMGKKEEEDQAKGPSSSSTYSSPSSSSASADANAVTVNKLPTSAAYNSCSTERFHWKKHAANLLKELSKSNLKPTAEIALWSLHDPIGALQKQHTIEQSAGMLKIVNSNAHHTFQKEAFDACEEFVLTSSSSSSSQPALQCKHFFDMLRFRVKYGVALPAELAVALSMNIVTPDEVNDADAVSLVNKLAPDFNVTCGNGKKDSRSFFQLACDVLSAGPLYAFENFTSALAHASGVPFQLNPAEWEQISTHLPLGNDAFLDRTRAKLLTGGHSCCLNARECVGGSAGPAARSIFYPSRLNHVDWSKATVLFLDLSEIDRLAFSSSSSSNDSCWDNDATFTVPFVAPEQSYRMSVHNIFAPAGGTTTTTTTSRSGPADCNAVAPDQQQESHQHQQELISDAEINENPEDRLRRWRHLLCVPKITTFSVACATSISDASLAAIRKRMALDPNLVVVIQPFEYGNEYSKLQVLQGLAHADYNFVEHVLLKSLPIAGFTTQPSWRGAAQWLEQVVRDQYGAAAVEGEKKGDGCINFTNSSVRVSAVCGFRNSPTGVLNGATWEKEPTAEEINASGAMYLKSSVPKCVVDVSQDTMTVTSAVSDFLGTTGILSPSVDDRCAFVQAMAQPELAERVWRGEKVPTSVKEFADASNWRKV